MSRYEDDHARNAGRTGDRNERRDPYEDQRQARTRTGDERYGAERPSVPGEREGAQRQPRWSEQPARYGGGYRSEELWGTRAGGEHGADHWNDRKDRFGYGDERYGYDQDGRAGSGRGSQRDYGRNLPGQNNSGYDVERAYGQGRDESMRASYTQEHDYQGPRYGAGQPRNAGRDDYGMQGGRRDTYGSEGFRQQGKRYWFDEADQSGEFRGTRPRGYERSDERLRELVCERLTDADIDASDIEVKVSQGKVILEGSVPSRRMRHQAEDIVDDCGGVKDIQNHLRVNAGGSEGNVGGTAGSPASGTTTTSTTSTGSSSMDTSGGTTGSPGDIGGRSRH